MAILSRTTARSLYGFIRTATLEALDRVTAPGDDYDRRFRTRSEPEDPAAGLTHGNFHLMLASAELELERFTLVVVGCGRGHSLLRAARYPWRRMVAAARSAEEGWATEHNLRVLLQRTGWEREVEVVVTRGEDFPFPPGPLVLVVDECEPAEAGPVLAALERSLRDEPRELAVFVPPRLAAEFEESPLLRRWREGDGWRCLVGRAAEPWVAMSLSLDPMRTPRWEISYEAPEALERLAPEWDELARHSRRGSVADSIWFRSWSEAFLGAENRLEVHSLRRPTDGRLLAVMPLRLDEGIATTRRPLVNAHHPYWSFAVDERQPDAMRSLLVHLLATRGDADLVELPRLHRGGFACERLIDAADALGLRHHLVPDGGDTYLRLGPWQELEKRLPQNARKHVPRKLRRLRDRGPVEFSVTTGGPELAKDLAECFALEAKGWKGVSGSPIQSRPETLQFYTSLAERSAAAGRFALYLLRLEGRIIAFEYCLRGDGRIDMLKLSYDPEFSQHSPGLILRMLLLEREAGLGEISSYHMGLPSEWKLQWASGLEPLCTLRVYAPSLKARALSAGPALTSSVKLALKSRPRLFSALRWGREQVAELRGRLTEASA